MKKKVVLQSNQSLWFRLDPVIVSSTNEKSIGAKIDSFVGDAFDQDNFLQVGDVLCSINNVYVKTDYFGSIMKELNSCTDGHHGDVVMIFLQPEKISRKIFKSKTHGTPPTSQMQKNHQAQHSNLTSSSVSYVNAQQLMQSSTEKKTMPLDRKRSKNMSTPINYNSDFKENNNRNENDNQTPNLISPSIDIREDYVLRSIWSASYDDMSMPGSEIRKTDECNESYFKYEKELWHNLQNSFSPDRQRELATIAEERKSVDSNSDSISSKSYSKVSGTDTKDEIKADVSSFRSTNMVSSIPTTPPSTNSKVVDETHSFPQSMLDVPSEMLDLSFLKQCTSMNELQFFFSALNHETSPSKKCPVLLRMIQDRINFLESSDERNGAHNREFESKEYIISSDKNITPHSWESSKRRSDSISFKTSLTSLNEKSEMNCISPSYYTFMASPLLPSTQSTTTSNQLNSHLHGTPKAETSKEQIQSITEVNITKSTQMENRDNGQMSRIENSPINVEEDVPNYDDEGTVSTMSLASISMSQSSSSFFPGEYEWHEAFAELQHAISSLSSKICDKTLEKEFAEILNAQSTLTSSKQKMLKERDEVERQLSSQIFVLSEKIKEMDQIYEKDKEAYETKLKTIQQSKKELETRLFHLEKEAEESTTGTTASTIEMRNKLLSLEHQFCEMTKEKEMLANELKIAHEQKKELSHMVEHLKDAAKFQMGCNREKAEKEIKEHFENQHREKIRNLCKNTNELEKQNSILQKHVNDQENINENLRCRMEEETLRADNCKKECAHLRSRCNEFRRRCVSIEAVAEKMKENLRSTESKLEEAIRLKDEVQAKFFHLNEKNVRLQKENFGFSQVAEHSKQEVLKLQQNVHSAHNAASAKYKDNIDSLEKEKKLMMDKYNKQIEHLKHMLNTRARNMVSIELYEKVMNEKNKLQVEIKQKSLMIEKLKSNNKFREKPKKHLLPIWKTPSHTLNRVYSINQEKECGEPPASRLVSPDTPPSFLIQEERRECKPLRLSNVNKGSEVSFKSPSLNVNSSSRLTAVRAMGGRAGLSEKLKMARGGQTKVMFAADMRREMENSINGEKDKNARK